MDDTVGGKTSEARAMPRFADVMQYLDNKGLPN
jgi:hypothetical protein